MIPIKDENPTETFTYVTLALIGINISIFIYQILQGLQGANQLILQYALIPSQIRQPLHLKDYSPYISSMFFHAGFLHLAGNMLFLWIFGNNIEDAIGHFRFFIFYLLCGILGSIAHTIMNPNSNIPTIGASGAISGVLGAYLLLYPKAKVITLVPIFYFIRIIKLPAFLFLGYWILLQFLYGIFTLGLNRVEGGVAWFGHIGGLIAGIILINFFIVGRPKSRIKKYGYWGFGRF